MDYIELDIKLRPRDPWTEIAIADLAENGFESFVETENGFMAYGREGDVDFNEPLKNSIFSNADLDFSFDCHSKIIPQQNWNAQWEADFKPVHVDDYCTIIAPFHGESEVIGMKIVIQPQMSFGTGHHQTTYLMTRSLFELPQVPEKVLDMGCGTGVLAIVAEKLGAKRVLAVDIEEWSAENTEENAERNNCNSIETRCGDIDVVSHENFGLILANINKNVLKMHIPSYSKLLEDGGMLMISGFFDTDAEELIKFASDFGLREIGRSTRDEWCCIHFMK
jgi:ribosomal protein L11 methyltransferase